MSDERRYRRIDERLQLRETITRARSVLEKLDAHMFFDAEGRVSEGTHGNRLSANAVELAEAIRDVLDVLNQVPEGYWRKYPTEYNKMVKIKDLGK